MKGIVVEINKKDSIVMTEDGLFTKIKNDNYEVGQTIIVKNNNRTFSKMIIGAASMVAALAICTVGGFAYSTPTDYVSLDVNPSVEYSINMFNRILDVKAVNDEGEEILSSLDLNNLTIEDAVKETLDKLMADGYLTDDPNGGVIITTSNDEMGDAEELAAQLEQEIQAYLDSQEGIIAEVDAEAVGLERVQEARALGVTPGKLNLVEKLQSITDGAIDTEEWLTRPVKEINKAIKENRKHEKNKLEEQDEKSDQSDQLKQDDSSTDDDSDKREYTKPKKELPELPASVNENLKPENEKIPDNETEEIDNENKNQGNEQKGQEQEQRKNEKHNAKP